MSSAFQEWVFGDNMSKKQQIMVVSMLRECDRKCGHEPTEKLLNQMTKNIRAAVLKNTDPEPNEFMPAEEYADSSFGKRYIEECDRDYVYDYIQMILNSVEIIGYKHPDVVIRVWFFVAYVGMTMALGIGRETLEKCDERLKD